MRYAALIWNCSILGTAIVTLVASPAAGYIHVPPQTLKEMCDASNQIRVLKVKSRDAEKGLVVFEVAESPRSEKKTGVTSYRLLARQETAGAKALLDKLPVGQTVVLFTSESDSEGERAGGYGYAFADETAFSADYNGRGKYWLYLRTEPGLSATYHGAANALPGFVASVLKGEKVTVPTKAPGKDNQALRAYQLDEARRRNSPAYPATPLPTAWGKPVKGLQAGIRVNPAVEMRGAAASLEIVIRTVGEKPVVFTHLLLGFGGENADGVVTARCEEVAGGEGLSPKGTRAAVMVSPGDGYALAAAPVFRPGEGAKWKYPYVRGRAGDNRVGVEGIMVRLGGGGKGEEVELGTGYLDIPVPPAKK